MQAQTEGTGLTPTHSQLGTRRRCVVNTTLQPFYFRLASIVHEAWWSWGRSARHRKPQPHRNPIPGPYSLKLIAITTKLSLSPTLYV